MANHFATGPLATGHKSTLQQTRCESPTTTTTTTANVSSKSNITCHWYQKLTVTGMLLKFRSCTPLQHKKDLIQGTVHRVLMQHLFGCPSIGLLKRTNFAGQKNQYPYEWSSKIVNQTLEKIISGGKDQIRTTPKEHQKNKTRSYDKPSFFLQNRGNLTQKFASKLKKLCELQVVFTTRKLRLCLHALKTYFDRDLESYVVYEIKCNGCGSIYVEQQAGMLPQG